MFSMAPYFGLASHLPGMEFPAKARPPEEVEGRLIVLHGGRGHQHGQHDPGFPAVNDVMVVVAKARATHARPQRGCVGVSGARPIISRPISPNQS